MLENRDSATTSISRMTPNTPLKHTHTVRHNNYTIRWLCLHEQGYANNK